MNGCVNDALVLAGILSVEKSIFVSFQKISNDNQIENFHKTLIRYSNGFNCDYLIQLNIYKEWSVKFDIDNFFLEKNQLHFFIQKVN